MNKLISSICLGYLISFIFMSLVYAASPPQGSDGYSGNTPTQPKPTEQQKQNVEKFEKMMKALQEQMRRHQGNSQGNLSPEALKAQREAIKKLGKPLQQTTSNKPYVKSRKRKPISKEEFEAQQKQQRAYSKKNKHILVGEWKNRYGDTARIQSGGHIYLSGYKHMYWENAGRKITFYKGSVSGSSSLVAGMRATYNKSTDKITFYGTKYRASTFYRNDAARKKREMLAKIEKRKRDKKILKRAMAQDKNRKASSTRLQSDFENTLTCNNCDLTILKDYYFDCSWCEAIGSNFSKKAKLWLKYSFNWANLKEANFAKTSIRDTSFYKANLRGANFSGAQIGRTNFAYANLENANFRNAVIGESIFNGANLINADFTGAKIVRADFSFAHVKEGMFKTASLETVKLKASNEDKKLLGVWQMNLNNASRDIYYYEFFKDGSYLLTKGSLKRISEKQGRFRVMEEKHYYSIRNGEFEKLHTSTNYAASSSKVKINISGDQLTFKDLRSSGVKVYTRTKGKALVKYRQFRNRDYALRSAYLWNTDLIEKFSSDGVNYVNLQDLYGKDIFDNLFQNVNSFGHQEMQHIVMEDRHLRQIFTILIRENKEFGAGSGFEKMLFLSVRSGYVDTVKYLLAQSSSKLDMQQALEKYHKVEAQWKTIATNPRIKISQSKKRVISIYVPKCVEILKQRISEL